MRLDLPIALRWADLDAYGHVNNAAMVRLLEEARIMAFWRAPGEEPAYPTAVLDGGPGAEHHTIVARTEIEYLAPLGHRRDPVIVRLWLGRLGGASVDVSYEVLTGPPDQAHARAETTIVLVEGATGAPRRIPEDLRTAWAPYVEEPVALRRR